MNEQAWQELLTTLEVEGKLHPSTVETLDAYEKNAGFKLPDSYRTYCQVFGAGTVGDWFNIAVPDFTGKSRNQYDLAAKTAFHHEGLVQFPSRSFQDELRSE